MKMLSLRYNFLIYQKIENNTIINQYNNCITLSSEMIRIILLSILLTINLYTQIKHGYCIYKNTCAKLIFNEITIYTSKRDQLKLYYENYHILKTILCNLMNNTNKLLCLTKNIEHFYTNPLNYTNVANNINMLYNNYKLICYNKKNLFDLNDTYINNKVAYYCDFNKEKSNSIIDSIIDLINSGLINIYNIIYCNIISIVIFIYGVIRKYNQIVMKKNTINKYTDKLEYSSEYSDCSICYENYTDQDDIRKLKSCNHYYHKECINNWVINYNNNTCPMCRKII